MKRSQLSAALLACFCALPAALGAQQPELGRQVEIRRTTYGVPHITAENLRAAGYAMGWVQLEDYGFPVAWNLYRSRGELGLQFGRDSVDADFANRPRWLRAVEVYPQLSKDVRDVYEGFAAGVNRYIELHPDEFPKGFEPDFSGPDVLTTDLEWPSERLLRGYLRRIGATPDALRAGAEDEGAEGEVAEADRHEPPSHFDVGSNSWALAPSRTKSGHAILMRNPHLNWNAGYYEMHLVVPGDINFYGDFRIGGPFQTIGGFNERLGFSTTNNAPDPDELYLLTEDPERADHYLFDGASIPIRKVVETIPYRAAGGALEYVTREREATHLGLVVHRADGKLHVWKVAGFEPFQLAEQWLAMMRARNLDQWTEAMRMLQKPSSNFTYADADGNIVYSWFGHQPKLKRPSGGDTLAVPASGADEVWTELFAYDELPRLRNPKGGYIHQENDPFHYTNLNEVIPASRYPDNFPRPALGLRSQHGVALVGGREKLSLEDVVQRKHSYRMLLADRVKDELIAAVRTHARSATADSALDLLARWDNTVSPESRGSSLFEIWWLRYQQTAQVPPGADRNPYLYAQVWTPDSPTRTPNGLADAQRAATAFTWALEEATRRYGHWGVAWGDVHRVRRGDVDEPVGGCSGALGCFRVLSYAPDADGKLRAVSGDGWVLAVEFGKVPRAYSVLAYGNSSKPDSPHFDDQAAMFARGEMKPVAFTEADIARATIRRYRPGIE